MEFDDIDCSFCGRAGATHEGGMEFDGQTLSGFFCDRKCFDLWVVWKGSFLTHLKKRPVVQS